MLRQIATICLIFLKKIKNNNSYKNKNKDILQYYTERLACCHCLAYVRNNLVGYPIDVKMFEALDWIVKENDAVDGQQNFDLL